MFEMFSFKKEAAKVLNKETFSEILKMARERIIELAKENIPGEEKKRQLDAVLTAHVYMKVKEAGIKNKWVLWLVDQLVDLLPKVTQLVYEFLKEKIENL